MVSESNAGSILPSISFRRDEDILHLEGDSLACSKITMERKPHAQSHVMLALRTKLSYDAKHEFLRHRRILFRWDSNVPSFQHSSSCWKMLAQSWPVVLQTALCVHALRPIPS